MKYAIIEGGKVSNLIEWDGESDLGDGVLPVAVPDGAAVDVGTEYDGAKFISDTPVAAGPVVPQSVSRAQAKLALLAADLLDDVEQVIAGMTGDELRRATIEWNERATFERHSPFLLQMAAALGLDDAALDALFLDAVGR